MMSQIESDSASHDKFDQLQDAVKNHVWLYHVQMARYQSEEPRFIVGGKGATVWDDKGKSYLDVMAGVANVNLGWGRTDVIEAIYQQMLKVHYVDPTRFPNVPATKLAQELSTRVPIQEGARVLYTPGGSEAVDLALKVVRQYHRKRGHQKYKTIARRFGFHGQTFGAMSVSGVTQDRYKMGPHLAGARHAPMPYALRCAYHPDEPVCNLQCVEEFRRIIEFEHPSTVGAVIVEPIQNVGGCLVPPREYYPRLREICDEHDIVLIADCVINGFGRTGTWFGTEDWEFEPDIVICSKGLTSGYMPLGAAIVRKSIADTFLGSEEDKLEHGYTFGGLPSACVAALKHLEILQNEDLINRSKNLGEYLRKQLEDVLGPHPIVGDIRGRGLFLAVELVDDKESLAPFSHPEVLDRYTGALGRSFIESGLLIRTDTRVSPMLGFAPPLTIQKEELDRAVSIVDERLTWLEQEFGYASR